MEKDTQNTILLVEDNIIIAMTQTRLLEKYNYNVINVTTGEEAIALFEKPNKIDLILMDIDLGSGLNGIVTTETILKRQELPIIFHSSNTGYEIIERTKNINSYGYIVKNSDESVIITSIRTALRLFKMVSSKKEFITYERKKLYVV